MTTYEDDIERVRQALIVDTRTTQEICGLAGGVSISTVALFRRGGTKALGYAAMKRLVPVVLPGMVIDIHAPVATGVDAGCTTCADGVCQCGTAS